MTDIDLKLCPFCGTHCAMLIVDQGDKWAHYEPACLEVRTGYDLSAGAAWRDQAIAAWNTRAAMSPALPDDVALLEGITPGPWHLNERNLLAVVSADGTEICRLVSTSDKEEGEQCFHNGRLLAAAPDLARENARLRECLAKANASAEEYERKFYLVKDQAEAKDAEIDRLRSVNAGLVAETEKAVHLLLFCPDKQDRAIRTLQAALAAAKDDAT